MNLTSNQLPPLRKGRYHRLDGWRGYSVPGLAILGSSDNGRDKDSPCPTDAVLGEIRRFRRDLKEAGIKTIMRAGGSSNIFCGKRWVCVVDRKDFPKAAQFALDWLRDNRWTTSFVHCADQGQLGYKESPALDS